MTLRDLTSEDRILWGRVARSVAPMKGKTAPREDILAESFAELLQTPPSVPAQPAQSKATKRPALGVMPVIDRPTLTKLSKGRLPIEAKVDLHGLTQSEAHALLFSFLQRAHSDGRRYVLVVTGKGSSLGSDGALKRAVPAWLNTPSFRPLVSGHDEASRHHGGGGALYIRLRRSEAHR